MYLSAELLQIFTASCLLVSWHVKVDAVSEDKCKGLSIVSIGCTYWLPSTVRNALSQINLTVESRSVTATATSDQPLVFSIDFESTNRRVSFLIKLAHDGCVCRGSHVNHVSTLVIATCAEVFAVRRDCESELIFQCVMLQLIRQISLKVVSNLGGVNWFCSARWVDYHAIGRGGVCSPHAHVPELRTQVVAAQNVVVWVGHEWSVTDYIEPLVEDILPISRLSLFETEFDRRPFMEVWRFTEVTNADTTFRCRIHKHWRVMTEFRWAD